MRAFFILLLLIIFCNHACFGQEESANRHMEGDCVNGQGAITFYDGSRYVGQFKAGEPHGYGTITFPDGSKYEGEFLNGEMNGQGTMTFSDGSEYVGEFKDGTLYGHGSITFPDGSVYEGQFKDNTYHGKGIWASPFGIRYEGQFKGGNFDGQGIYSLPDGSRYFGYFKDDNFHGQGTWTVRDTYDNKSDFVRSEAGMTEPAYEASPPEELAKPFVEVGALADETASHGKKITFSNGKRSTEEVAGKKKQMMPPEEAEPGEDVMEDVNIAAAYSINTQKEQVLGTRTKDTEHIESPRYENGMVRGSHDSKESVSAFSELSFSVQVGAFLSRQNAEKLADLLREKGYKVCLLPLNDFKNRAWYSVRIGSYPSFTEAQEKAVAFSEKEKMVATVRPVDSL